MSLMSQAKESKFAVLQNGDIAIEHAVLIWRNFEGRPSKFTPQPGRRSVCVVLTEEQGLALREQGWNVKSRPPRDEDDDSLYYTEIMVNLASKYPPKVFLCTESGGKKSMVRLDETDIKTLDDCELENVDLVIHPYEHGITSGGSTIKGYLRSLYAIPAPNTDFGSKYSDYAVIDETIKNSSPVEDDDGDLPF